MRFVALARGVATESLVKSARMLTVATGAAATAAAATTALDVVMAGVRAAQSGRGRRQLRDVIFKLSTAGGG